MKKLVHDIFSKHDKDKTGFLDLKEITPAFNEILKRVNIPIVLSVEEAEALLYEIDANKDRTINKRELFRCVKKLILNESSNTHPHS